MEVCYYNNVTKQYFFTKKPFESLTNCDHLERCEQYDSSLKVVEVNKKLKELVERFCIKSNGISTFVRVDWMSEKNVKEKIWEMYNFQCECEEILDNL
jgi:hypothetical protein